MSKETKIVDYLETRGFKVITKAPGAFFFFGEYAVANYQPALVMPIPRYIYIGIMKNKNQSTLKIRESIFSDDINEPRHASLASADRDIFSDDIDEQKPRDAFVKSEQIETISTILQKNFNDHQKTIDQLSVQPISDYPTRCGLNSSGAFSVALTLGIMSMFGEINQEKISKWAESKVGKFVEDEKFKKLFNCSWEIENIFHSKAGSGVGVFSSIVGSPKGVPLVYSQLKPQPKQDSERTTTKERKIFGFRLDEIISDEQRLTDLKHFIWRRMPFLIFCAGVRPSTEDAFEKELKKFKKEWRLTAGEVQKNYKPLIEDKNLVWQNYSLPAPDSLVFKMINNPTQTSNWIMEHYWKTIGAVCIHGTIKLLNMDSKNFIEIIKFNQNFLSPLNVLTPTMEKTCNEFYSQFDNLDHGNVKGHIGIKITGSGKGGDLIIIGDSQTMTKINKHFKENIENLCGKCTDSKICKHPEMVLHFYSDGAEEKAESASIVIHKPLDDALETKKNETELSEDCSEYGSDEENPPSVFNCI